MTAVNTPDLILPLKQSLALILMRLLFCCVLFVAAANSMAQAQGVIGYLSAGFVALFTLFAIVQLLPGSTYLRIANDGLTFTSRFCVYTIPWNVIDLFFVIELKQIGMTVRRVVGFNYVRSYDRAQLGRRIRFDMLQCEDVLPGTYSQKPEELADILNTCLARFKAGQGER